jgi:16S rRNA (uracil1498-N3)-methyltransferase
MRERRFFVPHLVNPNEIEIRGSEAHHLSHVLRLSPGDDIVVFDGRGRHYRAILASVEGDFAVAHKLEELPPSESPLELTLAVAIPKGDKMSLIIRMLTELGVVRVIPLISDRTVSGRPSTAMEKIERWSRVALEACKQSGRSRIPQIDAPISLKELSEVDLPDFRILVTPRGESSLPSTPQSPSVALIGPEGGWSREETDWAKANGFHELTLGPRTLRTETAAVTVASILQWEFGDLK